MTETDEFGCTPLIIACCEGRILDIQKLLKTISNQEINTKDKYNNSALSHAAFFNYPEIVKLLLKHNAKINTKNSEGNTPLMRASEQMNLEVVKILLLKGADTSIKNHKGKTALDLAKQTNNGVLIKLIEGQPRKCEDDCCGISYFNKKMISFKKGISNFVKGVTELPRNNLIKN